MLAQKEKSTFGEDRKIKCQVWNEEKRSKNIKISISFRSKIGYVYQYDLRFNLDLK